MTSTNKKWDEFLDSGERVQRTVKLILAAMGALAVVGGVLWQIPKWWILAGLLILTLIGWALATRRCGQLRSEVVGLNQRNEDARALIRHGDLNRVLSFELLPFEANAVLLEPNQSKFRFDLRFLNTASYPLRIKAVELDWIVQVGGQEIRAKRVVAKPIPELSQGDHHDVPVDVSWGPVADPVGSVATLRAIITVVAESAMWPEPQQWNFTAWTYGRVSDSRQTV